MNQENNSSEENLNHKPVNSDQADADDGAELDVETLKQQLAAAQQEAESFKDRYLRAMAEMENTRRRVEKEKQDLYSTDLKN